MKIKIGFEIGPGCDAISGLLIELPGSHNLLPEPNPLITNGPIPEKL